MFKLGGASKPPALFLNEKENVGNSPNVGNFRIDFDWAGLLVANFLIKFNMSAYPWGSRGEERTLELNSGGQGHPCPPGRR